MTCFRRWIVVAAILMLCRPALSPAATAAEVDEALRRAKEWLYSQQKNGNWEQVAAPDPNLNAQHTSGGHFGGRTAIAVYALLAAGENHQDPRLAPAIEFLKKTEMRGIYAVGIRSQVWLFLPETPQIKQLMKRDAETILKSLKTEGEARGFWDYAPGSSGSYSHSRSQYGVLGLWASANMGIEVDRRYWQLFEQRWVEHQEPDGGWDYQKGRPFGSTPGMAAAGVATLFITQDYVHSNKGINCNGNITNPAIDKGMKWLIANFDKVATDTKYERDFPYPTLYAIERVGVASGYKYFGDIDWYEKGANWLLKKQSKAGAWSGGRNALMNGVPDHCFAMLFLARGRAPIVISKLDYSASDAKAPWNQRPRDIANLTRWMGKTFERDLNWQIVNLSAPPDDLQESPILYISGNDTLKFNDEQKARLKLFIERGGLIIGNPDCGRRDFERSFRELGQELTGLEFRELPADHLIYTIHFKRDQWRGKPTVQGVNNGVREQMLLLPRQDPGRWWQLGSVGGREEWWELAANILLYSVERQGFRYRGETYLVAADPGIKPDRVLKLARLSYGGNWNPEPAGWRRLKNVLHNEYKVGLTVEPVELGEGKLAEYKVAHLTGTTALKLEEAERAELAKFIESGGVLIVDAAGGSAMFAQSVEPQLSLLVSGGKLEVLPMEHGVYAVGGKKLDQADYRMFARANLVGGARIPRIQGIGKDGKTVIYYSREDLSMGIVGSSIDGVLGYTPQSATDLMSRLVLYAGFGDKPGK